jgi:hypothetical protein
VALSQDQQWTQIGQHQVDQIALLDLMAMDCQISHEEQLGQWND